MAQGATGLMINAAETMAVMVNEEDHLRIQSIFPGLSVKDCWEKASAADDMIAHYIPAAFDSRWGYRPAVPPMLERECGLRPCFICRPLP